MRLAGADRPTPVGELPLEARTNYFVGDDPGSWRTDVPNFARVRYPEVYPGVDLVYYANRGRLEYDFVVAPGADPNAVGMRFEGADSVVVDERGELEVRVGDVTLRQHAPALYQEAAGGRRRVSGRYVVRGEGEVGFAAAGYDASAPLVIDPVLVYSTYLGGGGSDSCYGIAVDGSGSAYLTGSTQSTDFPTENPYQTDRPGFDAFVAKLSPAGDALEYSTYLGGNDLDVARTIAVDATGYAYVAGETYSTDFPTLHAYQTDRPGADAFVTKIGPAGDALEYSTYLGGSSVEFALDIAVDASSAFYVTGVTGSTDFPTKNPYQTDQPGSDAFVTKLGGFSRVTGNMTLAFSTYLGGNDYDRAGGVAVDGSGSAYLTGETLSTNFPTEDPYQTNQPEFDAFVTKLSPAGNALVYSTYLGGGASDGAEAIAVDAAGHAYVVGDTLSTDFPTLHEYQTDQSGPDVFVTKLSPAGDALEYSTYLGGDSSESADDIAVDASGRFHVMGYTRSTDFPTKNAYQTDQPGTDVFVAKLLAIRGLPGTMVLAYSTYLGGADSDFGTGIAVDGSGSAYVIGHTESANFPTEDPYQTDRPDRDVFVTKLSAS
jgi:hypothetical protein